MVIFQNKINKTGINASEAFFLCLKYFCSPCQKMFTGPEAIVGFGIWKTLQLVVANRRRTLEQSRDLCLHEKQLTSSNHVEHIQVEKKSPQWPL